MEILSSIKEKLKKKKEKVLFDIYIKEYDKSNFYFALVYNKNIKKYKVLFIPIDAIAKKDNIEEYFCYQFIFTETVERLIDKLKKYESYYQEDDFRNRQIKEIESYYIEINSHALTKDYSFKFNQFIDEDCLFLFDIIVVLFEHAPHIVNELCMKLLTCFQSKREAFHYNVSLNSNLDKVSKYFKDINKHTYKLSDVKFLEHIGNRYYGVINNNLIVIDYNKEKEIINISTDNIEPLGEEVYFIVEAIKNEKYRDFYRLQVVSETDDFNKKQLGDYYLSYGILEDEFQVIDASKQDVIPLSLLKKKCIKIFNIDKELEKELADYLNNSYEEFKVEELLSFAQEIDD